MKAIVMAGGEGTRLRPLTCSVPKPMVPLLDKPILEYTIELLLKHGIRDMAFTLMYKPSVNYRLFCRPRHGREHRLLHRRYAAWHSGQRKKCVRLC